MYPIQDFISELGPVAYSTDPITVRTKSRDYYAISPLLRNSLGGKIADIVVMPASAEEVSTVVKAAVKYRIPIVPRGGGTANYGQSVPNFGGIVMEMTKLAGVLKIGNGTVRALAGTMTSEIDIEARKHGWEMRLHPSTRTNATIAGFIAGGSGGMGSCQWGMLRDRGNITAMGVMSVEAEPRLIELRGRDVELVHHAYGSNAIMIEVEMPLAPAWEWRECIVAFPDYMMAAGFGIQLARETGILKKIISIQEWPINDWMSELRGIVPNGHTMANTMIASQSMEIFEALVAEFGGAIVSNHPEGKGPYPAPLYEYAYGHALRHVQKTNPKLTALQGMFPAGNLLPSIRAVHARYRGQMPLRMEIFWSQGDVVAMGSHFVAYESERQMADLVEFMQAEGVSVANNHASNVREVGIKVIDERDAAFKRAMDPHNLLNPGKMDFLDEDAEKSDHVLPTKGWIFKQAASA
jgi:FAD/FMN-containing dehydrogenase